MNSIFLRSAFILFSFAFATSLQAAPPQISAVSGSGPHPQGTTSVTIEIATDVLSNCRLNTVDDGNPSQWTTLLTTSNNLNHTSQVTLSNNTDTARYIYCRNVSTGEVSSSFTFNITFTSSNNTPPTINTTTGSTEVFEDSQYSYDVNATDAEDGTTLTYSLVSPPSGMSINETTGLILWTPNNDDVGDNAINIVVTDSGGLTDSESFTLNVVNVNDAPVITSTDVTIANEGSPYSYDVDATDPDLNDSLTYSLNVKPSGMNIDPITGLITWTPTSAQVGSQSVEIVVTDGDGATDQRLFTITVDQANVAPEIISNHILTATENVNYVYDVEATDGNNNDTLTFTLDSNPPQMSIDPASGVINWLPGNSDVGQHNVTVTVSDQSGLSDSESFVITVANVNGAPVFGSNPILTGVENELYSYDADATDDDSGDVVTYRLEIFPSGMSINASTGVVSWTPNSSQVGDHDITIEATDLDGLVTPHSYVLTINSAVADVGPVRTYISGAGPLAAGTTNTTMAISTDVVATCRYNNVDDNNPAGWTTGFSSSNGTTHTANITIVDGEDTTRYIICKETASGIVNQIAYAFEITFETSNNQAPVFDSTFISTATVDVEYIYDVEASDPDAGDTLTYSLLINPPSMSIDPNSGLITWTPTISDVGDHSILIEVTDQGGLSETQPYTLTVSEVSNQAPTITAIADQTIDEDSTTRSLDFTVADAETSASSLTVTGSSDNTGLIANTDIVISGTDANRSVVVTPLANESGTANITLTVSDGELSSTESFVVTVTAVNDVPTITSISNQTISEDSSTGSIAFTVDDEETAAASLTVTAISNNTGLVPSSNIALSGTGANRTVVVTPSPNQSGSATVTLTVSDGESSADESFVLTVNSVNDAPTITAVSDQTIDEDSVTNSLSFTIGDTETLASNLTVTSSSSNTTLVPSNNISLSGSDANRSVIVTPASNENGSATITLTVSDGQLSSSETFVVTVNSVNDLPTITSISNQSIKQNEATGSLSFTVGDVETTAASLTLSGSSNNTTLVPNSSIVFSGSGANRNVEITPASNQSGTATITIIVTDGNGGTQSTSFVLTVDAPPTVDAGADQTVDINANVTLTASASDVDGTIATYSWVQDENGAPTITLDPNDTDVLSFTAPSVSKNTVFSFTVTVTDNSGQPASDTVEVTVLGVVPDWGKSTPLTIADAAPVSPIILDHDIVGALEGQASVSGGAANYTIPIALPPGRAGMQPSVSLNYSSRSGNGIAGIGWSLGVGSSIHRCGQIAAVNGELNFGVTYDADEDRLCLDGKRLIVTSGGYGVGGAIYRTELDTFVKVVQSGGINSASSSFTVYHKNGRIGYYGSDANSRHSADGRTENLSWAIAREEDQSSNSIIYNYATYGLGEHLLESIEYTGVGANAGDRMVEFNYQTGARSDRSFSYLAGGKTERTKLLESISTSYNGAPIRNYYLNYAASESDTSERTILDSVQECAVENGVDVCLPATQFDTFTPAIAWDAELSGDGTGGLYDEITNFSSDDLIRMKDVNGDGIAEALHLIRYEIPVPNQISTYAFNVDVYQLQEGVYTAVASSEDPVLSSQIYAGIDGDINGDGITDFINMDDSDNSLIYYQFDENFNLVLTDTNFVLTTNYDRIEIGQQIEVTDINGDGYQDILFKRLGINGTFYVAYYLNKGNGNIDFEDPETLYTFSSQTSQSASLMDLDGDGLQDLAIVDSSSDTAVSIAFTSVNSAGSLDYTERNATQLGLPTNNRLNQFTWADINGDGLKDFVRAVEVTTNNFDWRVRLNQGDRTFAAEKSLGTDTGIHKFQSAVNTFKIQATFGSMHVADLDGDGADELLVPTTSDDALCITASGELVNTPSISVEISSCDDAIHHYEHTNTGNGADTYEADWSQYDFRRFHWSILDFEATDTDEYSSSREITDVAYAPLTDLGFIDGSRIRSLSFFDYDNDGSLDFFYRTKDQYAAKTNIPLGNDYLNVEGFDFEFGRKALFNVSFDTTSPGDNFFSQRNLANDLVKNADTIERATDGLGRVARWEYAPISRPDFVNGAPLYTVPLDREDWYTNEDPAREHFYFTSSMPVVTNFYESDGIGGENETTYRYKEAIYNRKGRGFQGFRTIIVDNESDIRAVTDFHQIFPKAGQIELATTCLASSDEFCSSSKISSTNITYFDVNTFNSNIFWVVPAESVATTYDVVSANPLSVKTTTINEANVDSLYGNVLTSTQTIDTGSTFSQLLVTTVNTYDTADESEWWIDKLNTTTVTSQTTTGSSLHDATLDPTKEVETSYTWTTNRLPDTVTVTPKQGGGKSTVVETEYTTYGLPDVISTYELNDSANARTVTMDYTKDGYGDGGTGSEEGYFVYKVTNDLGHEVTTTTFPEHGQVESVTDANGLTTETLYDPFGRIEQVTPPVGTGQPAYSRFALCDGGCDTEVMNIASTDLSSLGIADITDLISYKVTTTTAGAPETTLYKDKFNRVLVATTEGFEGSLILVRTEYDHLGRKVFESIPYFYADRAQYEDIGTHWNSFDAQGRLLEKRMDEPAGQWYTTTYGYSDHETTIDAVGTSKTLPRMYRTYNGIGQLMKTTDSIGGVTEYAYDSQGNPIVLQDANGNPITAEYNALGQKLYVDDPNMGEKTFEYTAFGEIDFETDAKGDTYYYDYDVIGRLTYRYLNVVPSSSNRNLSEASFTFDSASKGGTGEFCAGAIQSEVREDSGADAFNKAYAYDDYCRPSSVTTGVGAESYTQTTQYDSFYGRVKGGQTVSGITLETQYNDYGYATKSLNASTQYVYQEVTAMDARLNLTAAAKANGAINETREYTPETGQMSLVLAETDATSSQRHRIAYEYDDFGNLERQLVENIRSGSVIESDETYLYDDLHRLTLSSQVIDGVSSSVSYVYDAVGNITSKGDFGSGFVYGDISRATDNAGPNAVISVNKNTGGTATYEYDLNGNMEVGDGKTLTYNAFNKPLTINKNGVTSTFSYGADQMRYKQVKTGLSGGTETTIYIDKSYEEITQNGVTKKRSYLGDAIVTETVGGSDSGFKIGFVHRDRLGSVVTITDENGDVVDNKSFDPFGKPRKGTFETVSPPTLTAVRDVEIAAGEAYEEHTRRGFTDHEHLDDAELIHMNGRVYDYNLGRFLSVDPFIQEPGNSQSMNPYSYIMNNPLSGTDPSGYFSAKMREKHGCTEATMRCMVATAGYARALDNGTRKSGRERSAELEQDIVSIMGNSTRKAYEFAKLGRVTVTKVTASTEVKKSPVGQADAELKNTEKDTTISNTSTPYGADYKLEKKNTGELGSGITTEVREGVKVVKMAFTISGYRAEHYAKEFMAQWDGATGEHDGESYLVEANITHVDGDGGMVHFRKMTREEYGNQEETGKVDVANAFEKGGKSRVIAVNTSRFAKIRSKKIKKYLAAHEIGHVMGLTHAPRGSGSIMSYDAADGNPQAVTGRDIYNLYEGYK